jgi:hypothetical protein
LCCSRSKIPSKKSHPYIYIYAKFLALLGALYIYIYDIRRLRVNTDNHPKSITSHKIFRVTDIGQGHEVNATVTGNR